MKIAVLADIHWGVRSDSRHFLADLERFFSDVFFPYVQKHKIRHCVVAGDLVDRKQIINTSTAYRMNRSFIDGLIANDIETVFLAGNHDAFFVNTIRVNALREYVRWHPLFKVIDEPQDFELAGKTFLGLPWICAENHDASMEAIRDTSADTAFAHLELNGFETSPGIFFDHPGAMTAGIFKNLLAVYTGHFHHPSSSGNIHYLGACSEHTWADAGDDRGFSVYDTDTGAMEFVKNPYRMHHVVPYDDTDWDKLDLKKIDFAKYQGAMVKIFVKASKNEAWLDKFKKAIEDAGAAKVDKVQTNLDLKALASVNTEVKVNDTVDLIKECSGIAASEADVDPVSLNNLMTDLYVEAETTRGDLN